MGTVETMYERNLRINAAAAIKKDRADTLALAEAVARVTPAAAEEILKMLKERLASCGI